MEMDGVERFFALKPEESITVKGLTEVLSDFQNLLYCNLIFFLCKDAT